MTELDREQKIASGILIDVTDLMQPIGVMWPIAISEGVERWIQETVPREIGVPEELNHKRMEILDAAVTACFFGIVEDAMTHLQAVAVEKPKAGAFDWKHEASWKEGEEKVLSLAIESDENERPCFTIAVAGEWN